MLVWMPLVKSDCHLFLGVLWVSTFPLTAGLWPFPTSSHLGFHFLQQAVALAPTGSGRGCFLYQHAHRLACLKEKHNSNKQDSTVCLPIRLSATRESWQIELEEMLRAHWLIPFSQRDQPCLIQPWLLCLWFNKLKLQHRRCQSSPGSPSASPDASHDVCINISKEGQFCLSMQRVPGRPHPARFFTLVSVFSQALLPFLPSQLLSFPPCIQNLKYQVKNLLRGIVQPSQMCHPLSPSV